MIYVYNKYNDRFTNGNYVVKQLVQINVLMCARFIAQISFAQYAVHTLNT